VSSPFWAANLLGMVVLFTPAFLLFLRTIAPVEEQLEERKLYLACGGGTIFGTIAEALILVGGFDQPSPEVGYASLMFVTPALLLLLLWLGLRLRTFRDSRHAAFYAAGFGLFFGAAHEFWKLLVLEARLGGELPFPGGLLDAWFGVAAMVLLGGMALHLMPALQRDSGVRTAARLALLYLALGFLRITAIERPEPAIDAATALAFAAAAAATYQRGAAALVEQGVEVGREAAKD